MVSGRRVTMAAVAALLALTLASCGVAAQEIQVDVAGEQVEDGDEVDVTELDVDPESVDVGVSVSSDSTIRTVSIDYEGRTQYAAVSKQSYVTTTVVDVPLGSSTLTVTATTESGDEEVEVTLRRDATNEAELRSLVDARERDVEDLQDDIQQLQDYEENLSQENERLQNEVEELQQQVDESGEGLPGFTFTVFLAAFAAVAAARAR